MGQQRYVYIAPQYGHMGARVEWAGLGHWCHRLVCGIYPTQLAVSPSTSKVCALLRRRRLKPEEKKKYRELKYDVSRDT